MLRSLKELEQYSVLATDGKIGRVLNFLLDDEYWTVRYLVVETGVTSGGRRVLISPISFRKAEWSDRSFHLALTKDKVKNSPNVDTDKPVCRQHELDYNGYYGFPYYWGGNGIWGMTASPGLLAATTWPSPGSQNDDTLNVHLRGATELRGYHIQGSDDTIGHVEDFIIDDENWEVRYIVIDTSNWWFGKKVLVAPRWANRVSWAERTVYVDMSREKIKNSPTWEATAAVNREYEVRLYDFYGRPVYWEGHPTSIGPVPAHVKPQHRTTLTS